MLKTSGRRGSYGITTQRTVNEVQLPTFRTRAFYLERDLLVLFGGDRDGARSVRSILPGVGHSTVLSVAISPIREGGERDGLPSPDQGSRSEVEP
jgi:hypothetical protein